MGESTAVATEKMLNLKGINDGPKSNGALLPPRLDENMETGLLRSMSSLALS